jgi:hypothetical protein
MGLRGPQPGTVRKPQNSGRKKGTLNKATVDLKAIARTMEPEATKRLGQLLRSENEAVALGAVKEVYDRAFGKATQVVSGENGGAIYLMVSTGVPHASEAD